MISIRTGLVLVAFVATGLTAAAENLVERRHAEPDPFVTVGAEEATPAKVLRLARKVPAERLAQDPSPWI